MRVEVYGGDVGRALKKLKKKMFDDGLIKLLMERRFFEPPSAIRRKKKLDAINRQKKQIQRDKEMLLPPSKRPRPKKKKKGKGKGFGRK